MTTRPTVGRGRPSPQPAPPAWPARPAAGPIDPADPDRPTLRLLRWPGADVAPPRPGPADGSPKVLGRLQGWPLELRIWPRRPAGEPDAVYHPSGVWAAVRLLDA